MKYISLILIYTSITITSFGQQFVKKDMVLSGFEVQIDSLYGVEPDQNIYDDFYLRLEEALADSAGITIQPVSTLKENLNLVLGNFGYPQVGRKKAAKSGTGESYIKMQVELTTIGMISNSNDEVGSDGLSFESNTVKVKLRAITKMNIYDKNGKEVLEFKEQAVTDDKVVFSQKSFDIAGFIIRDADEVAADSNMEIFEQLLNESFALAAQRLK